MYILPASALTGLRTSGKAATEAKILPVPTSSIQKDAGVGILQSVAFPLWTKLVPLTVSPRLNVAFEGTTSIWRASAGQGARGGPSPPGTAVDGTG